MIYYQELFRAYPIHQLSASDSFYTYLLLCYFPIMSSQTPDFQMDRGTCREEQWKRNQLALHKFSFLLIFIYWHLKALKATYKCLDHF